MTPLTRDSRKSTPEGTWRLMIAALEQGDAETALSCFTPGMQSRLGPLFTSQTAEELRAMANSFTGFELRMDLGEFREAVVTRKGKDGETKGGFVYFVNSGGEWLIQQM